MTQAYPSTTQIAKSVPRKIGCEISKIATFPAIHHAITAFFERIQPKKTWALIAETLSLKEHTAKHRAANHTSYSVEELQTLLHGEDGAEVLDLLMRSASPIPQWWSEYLDTRKLTRARVLQAEAQQLVMSLDNSPMEQPTRRKIKRFTDADRNLSAARAEKELAVGLLHQNEDRAPDRVVAAAAAKTKIAAAGMRAGGRGR